MALVTVISVVVVSHGLAWLLVTGAITAGKSIALIVHNGSILCVNEVTIDPYSPTIGLPLMSSIKCRTCCSSMVVDRCESSGNATTCWHQCPVCKQVRLTSEYESAKGKYSAKPQSDDDSGFISDHDTAHGSSYSL